MFLLLFTPNTHVNHGCVPIEGHVHYMTGNEKRIFWFLCHVRDLFVAKLTVCGLAFKVSERTRRKIIDAYLHKKRWSGLQHRQHMLTEKGLRINALGDN